MKFSEKIKFLRKKNKLSQAELGKRVGVTNRAVSKWENGTSFPATDTLISIATVFGVALDFFLKDDINEKREFDKKEPGMESLTELYKIGKGPSSSHTMGPEKAARLFKKTFPGATRYQAVLMGSLAKMGKGYLADKAITDAFYPTKVEIVFDLESNDYYHPNTLILTAFNGNHKIDSWEIYSVGGGSIVIKGHPVYKPKRIYPHDTFREIADFCEENGLRLWEYAYKFEDSGFEEYLAKIWNTMKKTVSKGLMVEGELGGGLHVARRAKHLFGQRHINENSETKENRLVCSYAFATAEENAAGGTVVTAPTCGASGVLPAVLKYESEKRNLSDTEIYHAIATAGIIGNLIKTNASISGAECGCQAEIGSACAMASAALGEICEMSIGQIEYAAEISIEHHLGLTCDPIFGLVQIPCIERNAVAAMRSINSVNLANFLTDSRKISFDLIVNTMYETGRDLPHNYRETSEGGLAKLYK